MQSQIGEIHQSALLYKQKLKLKKKKQDSMILKWKFGVIALTLVLIVLVSFCSSLIKSVNSLHQPTLDTTFLSNLMIRSETLSNIQNLRHFLKSLGKNPLKFSNTQKLYIGNRIQQMLAKIWSMDHTLILLTVSKDSETSSFGIYLNKGIHEEYPSKKQGTFEAFDPVNQLTSMLFGLKGSGEFVSSKFCPTHKFNASKDTLQFFDFVHLDFEGSAALNPLQGACWGTLDQDLYQKLTQLVGLTLNMEEDNQVQINQIQVYELSSEQKK